VSNNRSAIRLAYLYPKHLNFYADRGNITVFKRRLEWRGLTFELVEVGLGESFPEDCDLYYIGGGQDRDQALVSEHLVSQAANLRRAVDSGAVVLAIGGGFQLLGHSYLTVQGTKLVGAGLFDVETTGTATRLCGDVAIEVCLDGHTETVVGYENHAGRTSLGPLCKPFGSVQFGFGNNAEDGFEGATWGRCVGTNLHGPLLPKNPWLADTLLNWALKHANAKVELAPLDDNLAVLARAAVLRNTV